MICLSWNRGETTAIHGSIWLDASTDMHGFIRAVNPWSTTNIDGNWQPHLNEWPCPTGYYVPRVSNWRDLIVAWWRDKPGMFNDLWTEMLNDLKIPLTAERLRNTGNYASFNHVYLRTCFNAISTHQRYIHIDNNTVMDSYWTPSMGYNIRCFKH